MARDPYVIFDNPDLGLHPPQFEVVLRGFRHERYQHVAPHILGRAHGRCRSLDLSADMTPEIHFPRGIHTILRQVEG